MKVIVVGGAGYIGANTVEQLIKDNNEVIVIDNLSTGYKNFVNDKAKFYLCDIRNIDELNSIFEKEKNVDLVMHFAAKIVVPESVKEPLEYYHNNVEGLRILLSVMKNYNIKNIVFSSTAAVYGEPKNGICFETDDLKPISPYGETKMTCENLIKASSIAYGMNYCIFRYFNVAGADEANKIGVLKDQLTHLIPIAIESALKVRGPLVVYGTDYKTIDGTCIRDYVHVIDLARAHLLGAKYLVSGGKSDIFNLGSNKGYSVLEVVKETKNIIDLEFTTGDRRLGDPAKLIASTDKAKEILKWTPKYSLHEIIKSDLDFRSKNLGGKK